MIWTPKILTWEQNQLKMPTNFLNLIKRIIKSKIISIKVFCKMICKNSYAQMITMSNNPNDLNRM